MNNREEHQFLAAYWAVVAEDAEGFALEQALLHRTHYLKLLGMLAVEGDDE